MKSADQGGKDMRMRRMIVVIRPVQIGRHDGDKIRTVLAIQKLTIFQSADLCQGISLVGLFQFTRQQAAFLHRLRCHPGIDTGGAQK